MEFGHPFRTGNNTRPCYWKWFIFTVWTEILKHVRGIRYLIQWPLNENPFYWNLSRMQNFQQFSLWQLYLYMSSSTCIPLKVPLKRRSHLLFLTVWCFLEKGLEVSYYRLQNFSVNYLSIDLYQLSIFPHRRLREKFYGTFEIERKVLLLIVTPEETPLRSNKTLSKEYITTQFLLVTEESGRVGGSSTSGKSWIRDRSGGTS